MAAVTEKHQEMTLYKFGEFSVLDTLDEPTARKWSAMMNREYEREKIRGLPLNDIVAEAGFQGQRIDLLSVEVEGHELSVLGSFDFAAYQPSVVVVEAHVRDIDAALGSPLYELLVGHGYHLTHWLNPSLIFQRSRAPEGTAVEPGPKVAP